MGDISDRREARRFNMALPLRVIPDGSGRELSAETRDVCCRGLYFLATRNFEKGSEIDFGNTLAQRMTHLDAVDIRWVSHIVPVEEQSGRMFQPRMVDGDELLP